MTPRERIRAALRFQPTDILPVDLGGMGSTGISAIAYDRLKKFLGITSDTRLYDVFQQLGWVESEVRAITGGDVAQVMKLRGSFGIKRDKWKKGFMTDGTECLVPEEYNPVKDENGNFVIKNDGKILGKCPKDGFYFDFNFLPYEHAETESDIDAIPMDIWGDDEISFIEAEVKRLHAQNEMAILLDFGGSVFSGGQDTWGYSRFLEYMAGESELISYYLDKLTQTHLMNLKNVLNRVGQYIDIINFCDDLGSQSGPQISLPMYKELIKPHHKSQFAYVRNNYPEVKVFLHCCGSIESFIPDLIDTGVEILNPVQISAANMDPRRLKREYGKSLVFWGGGANMQTFVNRASIDAICGHVRELVDIFSSGSGFVFSQIHNIQANVPPEKIMAIFKTAREIRLS